MSNHKTPLTELERTGIIAHGLGCYIGKPSQAADIFRQGVAWALSEQGMRDLAVKQREEIDALLNGRKKEGSM